MHNLCCRAQLANQNKNKQTSFTLSGSALIGSQLHGTNVDYTGSDLYVNRSVRIDMIVMYRIHIPTKCFNLYKKVCNDQELNNQNPKQIYIKPLSIFNGCKARSDIIGNLDYRFSCDEAQIRILAKRIILCLLLILFESSRPSLSIVT